MSQETPKTIWIVTGETRDGVNARGGSDRGWFIEPGDKTAGQEVIVEGRSLVEVETLKKEMRGFIQAMLAVLAEADSADSPMQLDEVELSVEINSEGQVNLFGIGGRTGGKGAMTLKFKRK